MAIPVEKDMTKRILGIKRSKKASSFVHLLRFVLKNMLREALDEIEESIKKGSPALQRFFEDNKETLLPLRPFIKDKESAMRVLASLAWMPNESSMTEDDIERLITKHNSFIFDMENAVNRIIGLFVEDNAGHL